MDAVSSVISGMPAVECRILNTSIAFHKCQANSVGLHTGGSTALNRLSEGWGCWVVGIAGMFSVWWIL